MRRLTTLISAALIAGRACRGPGRRPPARPDDRRDGNRRERGDRRVRRAHRRRIAGGTRRGAERQSSVHGVRSDRRGVRGALRGPRRQRHRRHPARHAAGRAAPPRRAGRALQRRGRDGHAHPDAESGDFLAPVGRRRTWRTSTTPGLSSPMSTHRTASSTSSTACSSRAPDRGRGGEATDRPGSPMGRPVQRRQPRLAPPRPSNRT